MGSYIEVNTILSLTHEQGFPKELDYEKHKEKPYTIEAYTDRIFEFNGKEGIRIYPVPPVWTYLVELVDDKWLFWGQVEIIETTTNSKTNTTGGKFKLIKLFSPEEMKLAEQIILSPSKEWDKRRFFATVHEAAATLGKLEYSNETELKMKYTNWKGETTIRTIKPIKVWFGTTEFHKGKHWFLKAIDIEKQAERDYAMDDILKIYPVDNSSDKVL
jgi:hypothetical protein